MQIKIQSYIGRLRIRSTEQQARKEGGVTLIAKAYTQTVF